ncbi:ATP phosphoribosyltransferase regulatory subunit [Sandarakinorhabdus sp.]|uniref:ATP phosphoribosyltransferase regulatory subunit n=1 Tax=Sandarakinorhabdus sp. TaxID=1916663 RepID=UPI00286E02A5|nr:ATP phosphoribosyltransferase regulatory subunit [Sandarakinorhabdus sp.]
MTTATTIGVTPGLLPEGLRDRLPPEAEAAATLVRTLTGVFASFGYERVSPPLMEYESSLAGGGGVRELLRFTDPVSQHSLALRSDMTGQVGRIAVTRLGQAARPLRLSYAGPVLRVRGDQLSPERERIQAGAELIGDDGEAAAHEIMAVAIEALRAAGVAALSIDITMPTMVSDLAASGWDMGRATLAQVQALLDGKDAGGLVALGAGAFVPLINAAGPADVALARLLALPLLPSTVAGRLSRIVRLVAGLDGVSVTLDPTERHGFEYQTWIGFSLFGAGISGEVGRGGAYALGTGEAAIGFSLYVDGLVDAGLGQRAQRRILLPPGTGAAIAARLRSEGWATVEAFTGGLDPRAYGCSHMLVEDLPHAVDGDGQKED